MTQPQEAFSPRRIVIGSVEGARYEAGSRPTSWEERVDGVETVVTADGEALSLFSNGGQSSPAIGWELLLTSELESGSYTWTLYGIKSLSD